MSNEKFVQLAVAMAPDKDSYIFALDDNGVVWRFDWSSNRWLFHSEHPRSGR